VGYGWFRNLFSNFWFKNVKIYFVKILKKYMSGIGGVISCFLGHDFHDLKNNFKNISL
jgi:hypothetical protein